MEYIDDGEIHELNSELNYILQFVREKIEMDSSFDDEKKELITKYAKYIYENDKNLSINFLCKFICGESHDFSNDVKLIYKPAPINCCLNENSSIALKFKKIGNDFYESHPTTKTPLL